MNQNPLHKKEPAPGRAGGKAGRPRMLAAYQAGIHAAVVTGRSGHRIICFACLEPQLLPVRHESPPGSRYYG